MKKIYVHCSIGYKLRHGNDAQLLKVRTISIGIDTIAFLRNTILQAVPYEIKDSSTIPIFKDRLTCVHHHEYNKVVLLSTL